MFNSSTVVSRILRRAQDAVLAALCLILCSTLAHAGSLTIRAVGPDGKVLPRVSQLYVCDMNYCPVATYGAEAESSTINGLPNKRLLFTLAVEVPGFGTLWFTADNAGTGYLPQGQTLDVLYEFARSRYLVARDIMAKAASEGCEFPSDVVGQMASAESCLKQAEAAAPGSPQQAALAIDSLTKSAPASETIVIERGRRKLDKQGGLRKNAMISAFALYEAREGKKWHQALDALFNGAVANWSWQRVMRRPGRPDFTWGNWAGDGTLGKVWSMDDSVNRLVKSGKTVRGHCMLWLNGIPKWYKRPVTYGGIKKSMVEYTHCLVEHYPNVNMWNIDNEACNSWDVLKGTLNLEPDQIVELTRAVSDETHKVNPKALRGINNVALWGDDAAVNLGLSPHIVSPWEFCDMLNKAKVGYEYIGMQIYFHGRDIFEVDRMLERYAKLGKRIRICESDAPSENGPNPRAYQFPKGHPGQVDYHWHRAWDPALQADWLEAMFIVCLSKDYVDEWNWWDVADYQGHYYPWGGIFDEDYKPKPAYKRLQELVKRWRTR